MKKVYVADVVEKGRLIGYASTWVWLWESPVEAINKMTARAQEQYVDICNIRRLR